MRALSIELRREKRTGVIPLMLAVGILGAAYALVNFIVRKDTLLNLPLAPMDVLLTQVYGMINQTSHSWSYRKAYRTDFSAAGFPGRIAGLQRRCNLKWSNHCVPPKASVVP